FRMLLGRTAMHHKLIVDPTQSFLIPFEENK
ncbi:ATP-dependent zinc protease, partial [Vibrio cholerae]